MLEERVEKRSDNWTNQQDKEMAKLLKEQAEKDKRAQEPEKDEKKTE